MFRVSNSRNFKREIPISPLLLNGILREEGILSIRDLSMDTDGGIELVNTLRLCLISQTRCELGFSSRGIGERLGDLDSRKFRLKVECDREYWDPS